MPTPATAADRERPPTPITVLPAHRLNEPWESDAREEGFDMKRVLHAMRPLGFSTRLANANRAPWNPWVRKHPIFRAIDPLRALGALLPARRGEILMCMYESAALVPLLARPVLRAVGGPRVKVVIVDVGLLGTWKLRERLIRATLKRADMVFVLTSAQLGALQPLARDPWRIVPVLNAVDSDFYQPQPDRPDGPIVAVGDDVSRDFASFSTAVAPLARDAIAKTRLIAEDRAAAPRLSVLSRRLSREDYRDLLAGAAIVVVPLHAVIYASGVSTLLEAYALGKPVIISDSPGMRDYLRDGETCLVTPCGDAEALRAAIRRLLDDAALRQRLGTAARAFAEAACSPAAMAKSIAAALRRIAPA